MFKSIRSKILLAILAVTMITACSITVVFYFRSAKMVEENYCENLYSRIKQAAGTLDDDLKEIYYVNMRAAWDEQIIDAVKSYKEDNRQEALEILGEGLRQYVKEYKDINSLYFIFPGERLAVTSEDYPVNKRNLDVQVLNNIQKEQEEDPFPIVSETITHEGQKQLTVYQKVEGDSGELLGFMAADMRERTVYYEYLEPVTDEKITRAYIVDKKGSIVTGTSYEESGKTFQSVTGDILPEDDGYRRSGSGQEIILLARGSFSGCGIYLEADRDQVLSGLWELRVFMAGIFLGFSVLGSVLAIWLSRVMCGPVKNMTDTIEKISEGDLSLRTEVTTSDEIGTLGREFNSMLDHIENLIGRVIREEQQKKDAELEALQYQITPHFMYNTLNSIKFAAYLKGEKELAGLIGDFVELLQASINKKGSFLTVADEIHILDNYIHLQEFRYQGSFQVEYDMEKQVESCYIPRLILQPLVENAILHGIDIKGGTGCIRICGKISDGRLTLQVSDNGRGMTREQIRELLNSREKKTRGLSAVGVPNVKERLELYYGKEGGMVYQSSDKGTTATIFLPEMYERPGRK